MGPAERETAMGQLLILAGLRHLEDTVEQEARKMPIYIDILENKVLGRGYKRGMQEGELKVSASARYRVGAEERQQTLEDLSVRWLDAQSIEDLLK